MAITDEDVLREFLAEADEGLQELDQKIVDLEEKPEDIELINHIFRVIHSVKGGCGFFGLKRLETIAHNAESLLDLARSGELHLDSAMISCLLQSIDIMKIIVTSLVTTSKEPQGDDSEIISSLEAFCKGSEPVVTSATNSETSEPAKASERGSNENEEVAIPTEKPLIQNTKPTILGEDKITDEKLEPVQTSLRVNIDVLESLMNLAGELVLTRNQLLQLSQRDEGSAYGASVQQLNRVTSDIQEAVMKTRMQPIGNAWGKLPRVVRDLAQSSGKKIELEQRGKDTEVDRQILQAIQNPMTHMVRNAADHGLESEAERIQLGKDPVGQICLEAFHEGGHIIIKLTDDGRGLNIEAIRRKAIEKGLATESQIEKMGQQQIVNFIFEPGFSTASAVTNVSGRGVGMDVVRRDIEKVGGSVELQTEKGKGTSFLIKIPLTLAIVPALVIGVKGQAFAIPQICVGELLRLDETTEHQVENIHGARVFRLRDKLLPLVSLRQVLKLENNETAQDKNILVIHSGDHEFGLIVEEVFDTQDIVVKPIGRLLSDLLVFSGTTILGDGRVIMILDASGIANRAGIHQMHQQSQDLSSDMTQASGDRVSLLLFTCEKAGVPKAVPLSQVARLEEFSPDRIESVNGRNVAQYRGGILPIELCDDQMTTSGQTQSVIVFEDQQKFYGLAVYEILDIVEESITLDQVGRAESVCGVAIVQGRSTEVIDVHYYLNRLNPKRSLQKSFGNESCGRLLVVEDSSFFRQLLKPLLESEGYSVMLARNGREALDLVQEGLEFDLILSDLEMPEMDGYELIENLKSHFKDKAIPAIVALTSKGSEEDISRGRQFGFDAYLLKFNRDEVLRVVEKILNERAA